jgi:hypothetical protein
MFQILIDDTIKTSSGLIGKVARIVVDQGARFYRVQQYAQMGNSLVLTRSLAFVAHSEIVAVKHAAATAEAITA